ncbi:hypothetical protein ACEWY4_017864 [Coilia grayii]|uniref:IF rod domain-containing protein n=1 Tax=Coilia grayii TaxID=363190 RepID=A0ABD1JKB3_9TELE
MSARVSRNFTSSGGTAPFGFASSASGMNFSAFSGGSSRLPLYGNRAPSVYGGAGGYGTRVSSAVSSVSMASPGGEMAVCVVNEKQTMQNLNDRLASYLEKVKTLEAANQKLELQIKEFLDKRCPARVLDHAGYSATIEGLRKQIDTRIAENAAITAQVDNAKLAAEDFRLKFENESNMRMSVEADIARLKAFKSELELLIKDLEVQISGLNEELAWLRRNHEEELVQLRAQQSGSVHVELDCAPPVDLERVLQEMREQYEMVIQKNHRDAEKWFEGKTAMLQTEVSTGATEVMTSQTEVTESKRLFKTLEIELQGLLTQKGHMEQQLSEVGGRYGSLLGQLQLQIDGLEEELQQLGASIQQQAADYQLLLNIKMRLEMEIAEYRRLLEGEGCITWTETQDRENVARRTNEYNELSSASVSSCMTTQTTEVFTTVVEEEEDVHNPLRQRRVKVIMEELVDGVVVATSVDEKIQEVN